MLAPRPGLPLPYCLARVIPRPAMDDASFAEKLKAIRLLAMDVDGVLTDGSILLGTDASGKRLELKAFNVKDGLAIGLAQAAGLEIAWITGRISAVVEHRAGELRVRHLIQWARNKRRALADLKAQLSLHTSQVLYIGDDLNDVPAFGEAGVRVAVADAPDGLAAQVDWVTTLPGGRGAVREVIERVLRAQGRWDEAVTSFLARLELEDAQPPASTPAAQ
jgi:3-deoxy-D-manno-octulosonate 8-phosphate phosphatase (KDO 8-P phosphatase)